MEAIRLAKSKAIEKLVVWRFDRLGRDEAEYLTQLRNLRRIGVEVMSATQPNDSILVQNLLGILAGEESRQIAVRVAASKRHRVKEGKWSGGVAPIGYDTVKHSESGRELVPNDDAPLVRELFTMYASGKYTLNDLRNFMNEKRGSVLTRGSIWNLLRNPVYIGMIRHGYWSRSKVMPRPKEVTQTKGLHPAIVDAKTFDKVQARLSANKSRANGGTRPQYLFSGLLYCGSCGHRYAGHKTPRGDRYYYCNRKMRAGDCEAHGVAEARIRQVVLQPLEALIGRLETKKMRALVRDELILQQAALDASGQVAEAELESRQARLETKLTKLEDLFLDGNMSKERYLLRRDRLQIEADEIKAKLAGQLRSVAPDMDELFAIADSLNGEPPDDEEWREIIVEMVERVEIKERNTEVVWREAYRPLLTLA
jgi:site-specific DNA recombinase